MAVKLPPIEIQKLYAGNNKTGDFTLRAKDLPADVIRSMTDAELMERRDAERKALEAEWKRIEKRS